MSDPHEMCTLMKLVFVTKFNSKQLLTKLIKTPDKG